MNPFSGRVFDVSQRMTLLLSLLIGVIVVGNGLVMLEFGQARRQTDRSTGVSHQLIAALRLQETLVSFHQKLDEMAVAQDPRRLAGEAKTLETSLLAAAHQTRSTLEYLPAEFRVDPAFLTALDAMETTLPAQLADLVALGGSGDWSAFRLRLKNEFVRMESTISRLVEAIERELDEDLPRSVSNIRRSQQRILFAIPMTALSTVLIAAYFGSAAARRMLNLRMEERLSERTRIARELHDTLLQSFQGVLLKVHAVTFLLPHRADEARTNLQEAIEDARRAIAEGRDAVQGLRSFPALETDLAQAISTAAEGLASADGAPQFRIHVAGTPRQLPSIVRDEVYRITGEALRNAFRHSGAKHVEVEVHYEVRQLTVRVRDDGHGMDPGIIAAKGRTGHHGLPGMHERARLLRGALTVWSEVNCGVEIELTVPDSVAYEKGASSHAG